MAYEDLRAYLKALKSAEELAEINAEVSLEYELGAVCRHLLNQRGPAPLYNNLKGSGTRIVSDIFASRKRLAMALETTPENIHAEWNSRLAKGPTPWKVVKDGPCKENILKGDDVDLYKFSIPTWNSMDGGPFITVPLQLSADPETGWLNGSLYRTQVFSRNRVGIKAGPYRHLTLQRAKVPNEPFPVAIALGCDPSLHVASVAAFPYGVDEVAMAGSLRGAPVEMVRCETIPVHVPATAEIVLECEMIPGDLEEEGLFGEFTGYYGIKVRRPVLTVKCITHRNNPIHLHSYEGRPPQDTSVLQAVLMEAEILRQVTLPGIQKIHVTDASSQFTGIVSVKKLNEGYGKQMGLAVFGTWPARLLKHLIVVDEDIDPFNQDDVDWALATRVQPHRDVQILNDMGGSILDPSIDIKERQTGASRTSKMIIDATKYDAKDFEIPCSPRADVMERVVKDWAKYGIPLGGK